MSAKGSLQKRKAMELEGALQESEGSSSEGSSSEGGEGAWPASAACPGCKWRLFAARMQPQGPSRYMRLYELAADDSREQGHEAGSDWVWLELDAGSDGGRPARIRCHQSMLVASMEHFAVLFESGFSESTTRRISVPGVSHASASAFLQFLYTGGAVKGVLDKADGCELFNLSVMWGFEEMRSWLLGGIFSVNVCAAAHHGVTRGDAAGDELVLKCRKVFAKNPDVAESCLAGISARTAASLMELSKEGMKGFEFVQKWWDANKGSSWATLEDARRLAKMVDLSNVRLDLQGDLKSSVLFNPGVISQMMQDRSALRRKPDSNLWGTDQFFMYQCSFVDGLYISGVAVGSGNGEVLVSDPGNCEDWGEGSAVMLFDLRDEPSKCVRTYGDHGSRKGFFRMPEGVAFTSEGDVIVADSGKWYKSVRSLNYHGGYESDEEERNDPKVLVYSMEGTFKHKLEPSTSADKFVSPRGVTTNCAGEIIVCDNNKIHVFKEGLHVRSFGDMHIKGCTGVAMSHQGEFVLVNPEKGEVCFFTPQGDFVRSFKSSAEGARSDDGLGRYDGDYDLAIAPGGTIVVAGRAEKALKLFSPQGVLLQNIDLASFSKEMHGQEENSDLQDLYGVAIDASGDIFVTGPSYILHLENRGAA